MASDDLGIVERVDERQSALVAQPLASREGLADVLAVEHDLGAVAEARLDLRADRAGRHDDGHRDARPRAGPGVGLARVAGRERDRRPRAARPRSSDAIRCVMPRGLEGAGLLEVLGLEVQAAVGDADGRSVARIEPSPSADERAAACDGRRPTSRSRASMISRETARVRRPPSGGVSQGPAAGSATARVRADTCVFAQSMTDLNRDGHPASRIEDRPAALRGGRPRARPTPSACASSSRSRAASCP